MHRLLCCLLFAAVFASCLLGLHLSRSPASAAPKPQPARWVI